MAALTPGHQEDGRRGGTPSVAFAEATALALDYALTHREANARQLEPLRDRFEAETRRGASGAVVNGARAPRVPNTSSVTFPGVDGEALLIALDLEGIAASTGAACASGSLSPSHVLLAMGLDPDEPGAPCASRWGPMPPKTRSRRCSWPWSATSSPAAPPAGTCEREGQAQSACRTGPAPLRRSPEASPPARRRGA